MKIKRVKKKTIKQKVQSWWLGKKIRYGIAPRGRSSQEVMEAIGCTHKGICGEIWGVLSAKLIKNDGTTKDLGVISTKKVTTAFRDYIVDALQDSTTYPMDVFKYHDSGTGVTAEANTQTALVTPSGIAREIGTQIEGATANIFKTVATITYDGVYAIVEHGLFSAAAAGTLLDRSLFTVINVADTDSIEYTYECTFNAEA